MMKLENFMLMLFAVTFFSCSRSDESDLESDNQTLTRTAQESVIQSLAGKWQLVRQGKLNMEADGVFIEFDSKGNVVCEYGVGSDNYRKAEFVVTFEDDWTLDKDILQGHLIFPLNVVETRFLSSIEGEELVLLPDQGYYYVMDSTKYFVKVIAK